MMHPFEVSGDTRTPPGDADTTLERNSSQLGDGAVATQGSPSSPPPPDDAASQRVTIIRPTRGWRLLNLRELWHFRELIFHLAWRDVKVRYKQTVLGAAWAVLQPIMLMVVFTIFFGRLAKIDSGLVDYPLFVFVGVWPWSFFATALTQCSNSVVNSEHLITKIYFPRMVIPLASIGARGITMRGK
jgi:lipopolysaccharide transport system permease protein